MFSIPRENFTIIDNNCLLQLGPEDRFTLTTSKETIVTIDNCDDDIEEILDNTVFDSDGRYITNIKAIVDAGKYTIETGVISITHSTNNLLPIGVLQNLMIELLKSGSQVFSINGIVNGSCKDATRTADLLLIVSNTICACSKTKNKTITITLNDEAWNDISSPYISQDIKVQLGKRRFTSISISAIGSGFYEDVTLLNNLTFSLHTSGFDCSNNGTQIIVLKVVDEGGTKNSATSVVTVKYSIDADVLIFDEITMNLNDRNTNILYMPNNITLYSHKCDDNLYLSLSNYIVNDHAHYFSRINVSDIHRNQTRTSLALFIIKWIVNILVDSRELFKNDPNLTSERKYKKTDLTINKFEIYTASRLFNQYRIA